MSQTIKCPKCGGKDWSSDYWYCPHCNYYVGKEGMLLEMNKDYQEGRDRGDEPALDLSFWMEEQKDLTREMINECLPRNRYNYVVDCNSDCDGDWGETIYHENDFNEADLFVKRHAEILLQNNCWTLDFIYYADQKGNMVEKKPYRRPIYPNYSGSFCCPCPRPTKIKIAKQTLLTEGEYKFDGDGYFPTIPHETAHADPAVKRHPQFKPLSSQYDPSRQGATGHDEVWRNKNGEFYNKLRPYIKKVKDRFKELRKIKGEDGDKYDDG